MLVDFERLWILKTGVTWQGLRYWQHHEHKSSGYVENDLEEKYDRVIVVKFVVHDEGGDGTGWL